MRGGRKERREKREEQHSKTTDLSPPPHTHTQGSVNLMLPTDPTSTTPEGTELGLLYGTIFATLVIACVIVVVAIMVLKYVQMTRRDTDKGGWDTIPPLCGGCGTI